MSNIVIISSSIRPDRKSHRIALFFNQYIVENKLASVEIIDLMECNFPLFNNPLKYLENPDNSVVTFAQKIKMADGIIIVTPEYNGTYPASLKNAIDVLYEEWRHKPVGIVTASAGPFAGTQALIALQFTLWKMKAWTITEMFSAPNLQHTYDDTGVPANRKESDELAQIFMKELIWCMNANKLNLTIKQQ
jgi:NAD(P)H-dependent FMN reductase